MEIVFVGAGRLATQLAKALHARGEHIVAVYSRTLASASTLCLAVGGFPTDDISSLPTTADAYLIAVKDSVLPQVAAQLIPGREHCPMFHTAGSVSLGVLGGACHYGVIYPMQTFSKERDVDFTHIPIFIEANDERARAVALALAQTVSDSVTELTSEQRRYLHLAAVFACNFANHSYALAAKILEQHGMNFDVMLPLIDETAQKVHAMHPLQAQTGPAVRYDKNVIEAQKALLSDEPMMQLLYDIMSKSIHTLSNDQL